MGGHPGRLGDLDGVTLPLKDQVQNLGVLLDLALSMEKQILAVAKSAFFHLRQVDTPPCPSRKEIPNNTGSCIGNFEN